MRVLSPAARARLRDWLRARDLDLIAALLILALLLWALIHLSEEVLEGPISLDDRILVALRNPHDLAQGWGGRSFEGAMRDLTALGSGTLAILFSVAFVGWLLLTRRPGAALFVTVAMLGAGVLNEVLKDWFGRERPTIVPHLMGASDLSFPSGHTMISAVLYPTMAELIGRLMGPRSVRLYLMGFALVVAILVAFSRVYLGVHYPSDVLGGLSAGFAWALVCGIVARLLQRRHVFRTRPEPEADADAAA
jgi:undecaprenyl-diphosphatase